MNSGKSNRGHVLVHRSCRVDREDSYYAPVALIIDILGFETTTSIFAERRYVGTLRQEDLGTQALQAVLKNPVILLQSH